MTSAPPVAYDGIDAKIGAKKMEMKNAKPAVMAVSPVFPPSEMMLSTSFSRNAVRALTTDTSLWDKTGTADEYHCTSWGE